MADTHDCQSEHSPNTWEHFLTVLDKEFKNSRQAAPKIVDELRFTDLNYSVRVAAVLRVTRDVGVMLNKEDFNHVVVGRLTVRNAFAFIQKKVQDAHAPTHYENNDRANQPVQEDVISSMPAENVGARRLIEGYAVPVPYDLEDEPFIPASIVLGSAPPGTPFKF